MARAYFKCGDCGASVQTSGTNRSDADRRAKWHEAQGHLCSDCEAKRRAIQSAKAAEVSKAAGLIALSGSEKQVAWAETIRERKLASLNMIVQMAIIVRDYESDERIDEDRQAIRDQLVAFVKANPGAETWRMHLSEFMRIVKHADRAIALLDIVKKNAKSSWWIDNRDTMPARLALELRGEIDAELAAHMPIPAAEAEAMQEAQADALLKPACEPKSQQVAEISLAGSGKEIRVSFAEKREDFRLLMRGLGFAWSDRFWARSLNFMQGDPIDRMAETAHRILALGYLVRLHDDDARSKAVSGDFQPEQTRWVVKANGGAYDGWCRISWPKSDDLYEPAKRIIGARYKDGHVYCPPGSIVEVADFAERYGFAMSESPRKMLEAHQAALAGGVVVTDIKAAPKAVVDHGDRPELCASASMEIADELLDHD